MAADLPLSQPGSPSSDITLEIDHLFGADFVQDEPTIYNMSMGAFEALARFYAEQACQLYPRALSFDFIALRMMLARFGRDAYGMRYFDQYLARADFVHEQREDVLRTARARLGIRINSINPRKTRVAAAFALWLATLRPVFVEVSGIESAPEPAYAKNFCAGLNLWLCCTFLERFGRISFGEKEHDAKVRRGHIIYDFTYRHLSLSSLELFFCSVFRPNEDADKSG